MMFKLICNCNCFSADEVFISLPYLASPKIVTVNLNGSILATFYEDTNRNLQSEHLTLEDGYLFFHEDDEE